MFSLWIKTLSLFSRAELNIHFLELKHGSQKKGLALSENTLLGGMTAADSIKLSSYIVAACKTYDQIMLIAHTLVDSSSLLRDTRWTSFIALSGSAKTE